MATKMAAVPHFESAMTNIDDRALDADSPVEMQLSMTSSNLVRSRSVVLRVLNSIMTQDLPLSVRFLNAGCAIETSLIFVDEASSTLLLTCPPEWELMMKAPRDSLMVSCVFAGNKLEFQAGACAKVDLDGTPVVGMPIPEFLWRFQRRADARHTTEVLSITLNLGFLEAEGEVVNLSGRGVGLVHCERGLQLTKGEVLRGCKITVPGLGRVAVDLVICHHADAQGADGKAVMRMGCQFVGLSDSARQVISHYLAALAGH